MKYSSRNELVILSVVFWLICIEQNFDRVESGFETLQFIAQSDKLSK